MVISFEKGEKIAKVLSYLTLPIVILLIITIGPKALVGLIVLFVGFFALKFFSDVVYSAFMRKWVHDLRVKYFSK